MHIGQEILALLEWPLPQVRYLWLQQIDRSRFPTSVHGVHDQQHIIAIEQLVDQADTPNTYLYHGNSAGKVRSPG